MKKHPDKVSLLNPARVLTALSLGVALVAQTASARLYDSFYNGNNWSLANGSGTAVIASSQLTLTSPASVGSTPTATGVAAQALTGTRQSILVRSHTPSLNHSVFLFTATSGTSQLEFKIDDSISTPSVVAGYWISGVYHWVATTNYSTGADGVYMAFRESGGYTYWEISTDASTWVPVAQLADPFSLASVTFAMENKGYSTPPSASSTVVDCFNYKLTGGSYANLEDKTTGWGLYTEALIGNTYYCQSPPSIPGMASCSNHIYVNGTDSSQHFTDATIPLPRHDTNGYHFEMISNDSPVTRWYENAYRYQNLDLVDADTWTYKIYFKYTYPEKITQGIEFPLNKYTNGMRLQGALGWYPVRPNTNYSGLWRVWAGTNGWVSSSQNQTFTPGQWYEVTFTVGLHDGRVYYSGFQAGPPASMTPFTWTHDYPGTSSSGGKISAAIQLDSNIEDTTTAGTQKNLYLAEWNIIWQDIRLP